MTPPTTIIRRRRGLSAIDLRELWSYRDLFLILAGRDVKLRYKQTFLGILWVVLQPLLASLIFALVFGRFAQLPSEGQPYVLFVMTGMIAWSLLAGTLQRAGNSLVSNANLISKVYFPRIIIPLSALGAVLVDFAVSLLACLGLMAWYKVVPSENVWALLPFALIAILTALGASLAISSLNVYYRDFVFLLPFLIQIWTYASPVAYSTSLVPRHWLPLFSLNPAVGFIEGFRWSLLGTHGLSSSMVVSSLTTALILAVVGLAVFQKVERGFADKV